MGLLCLIPAVAPSFLCFWSLLLARALRFLDMHELPDDLPCLLVGTCFCEESADLFVLIGP